MVYIYTCTSYIHESGISSKHSLTTLDNEYLHPPNSYANPLLLIEDANLTLSDTFLVFPLHEMQANRKKYK